MVNERHLIPSLSSCFTRSKSLTPGSARSCNGHSIIRSMNPYLEKQLPLLGDLHKKLGLCQQDLDTDLEAINDAIKRAIDEAIGRRKEAVRKLEEDVEAARTEIRALRRALDPDHGQEVMDAEAVALPAVLGSLKAARDLLKQTYEDRVVVITDLHGQLSRLRDILGKAYPLPEDLLRRAGLFPCDSSPETDTAPQDVTTDRVSALKELINIGQLEKDRRSRQLQESFDELRFLHLELGLEPMDSLCQSRLLPASSSEEMARSHASALHRFITMCSPEEDQSDSTVLAEQPTGALMSWAKETVLLWQAEKKAREEQIQALYDQVEPIWHRLGFEQDDINAFVEEHCGLDQEVLQAYRDELSRVKILRQEKLASFIDAVRSEITGLWQSLHYGPQTCRYFEAFYEVDESEDALTVHEEEAQRLQSELNSKEGILQRVEEWADLRIQQQELEAKRNGPDRFNTRGGALLLEERTRKRIEKKMPLLEQELMQIIPPWENQHDMPFLFDDVRITDIIQDEMESRAAERNAKMRSRGGSSATPGRQTRTPAPSTASRTPGTALARKRDQPTPTPSMASAAAGMKRTRLGVSASSTLSSVNGSPVSKQHKLPPPHYMLPKPSTASQSRSTSTPMPLGQSSAINHRQNRSATNTTSSMLPKPVVTGLAKADGRRPRRQSFKPRQSVVQRPPQAGMRGHIWSNVPEDDVM
ncbi:hypothetical protein NliqN6_5624 [Naganishia liquefaciens]|uniref:Uncharacterized protein n=1 Tax=Naganishia liquefaciens TaxID=104408 RepID=A0A8H3TY39_9TREE|nr:hypothetical protein NliqN6_5624 [Naganishia liquefaciens]